MAMPGATERRQRLRSRHDRDCWKRSHVRKVAASHSPAVLSVCQAQRKWLRRKTLPQVEEPQRHGRLRPQAHLKRSVAWAK
jgi:hypothetical protein